MLTRYQARAQTYNRVLSEPLMLSKILSYLSTKDIVNLKTAGYSKDTRFNDTIDTILKTRRVFYFSNKLNKLMDRFEKSKNMYEIITNTNAIFDFVLANHWFKLCTQSDVFYDVFETKLIEFLDYDFYVHNALYYLGEIFAIFLHTDSSGDYVMDSKGDKHYI